MAGLQGPYRVRHLCELIHSESATALASYRDDFYAGRPAVTVNPFGAGKAWYVASRNDLAFQRDFFGHIIDALALPRALPVELPPGVTAQRRTDGEQNFLFLQNFSDRQQTLTLPEGYEDMVSGMPVAGDINLTAWGCRVLRHAH